MIVLNGETYACWEATTPAEHFFVLMYLISKKASTQAKQICVWTTAESRTKVWTVKFIQAPLQPLQVVLAEVCYEAMFSLLLIYCCLIVAPMFVGAMFGPYFVVQHLM